jgi:hypothetical protein
LHVFAGHGGAVLIGTVGGSLTATLIERAKHRRLRRLREEIGIWN